MLIPGEVVHTFNAIKLNFIRSNESFPVLSPLSSA